MKKVTFREYITPEIETVNLMTEQVFAVSGFDPATHDGYDFNGWDEAEEF